jgi:uncharacterized protein
MGLRILAMHFSGHHIVDRGREELFDKLLDPAVLMKCIPGCEELIRAPDGSYQARLGIKRGLFRVSFTGRVTLRDVVRPERYSLDHDLQGRMGTVSGVIRIELRPVDAARTEVRFEGDLFLGGLAASLGELALGGAAEIPREFFAALERTLREADGR